MRIFYCLLKMRIFYCLLAFLILVLIFLSLKQKAEKFSENKFNTRIKIGG